MLGWRGEKRFKVAHQNYIEAARLSGLGTIKILFKHVMRNIVVTMLVYATLDIGTVILVYSGLSYLGLSVRPPQPDWGEMVSSYQDYLITAPWLPIIPGVIIALGVIGFSLLGDGLRDLLEAVKLATLLRVENLNVCYESRGGRVTATR